MSVVAFDGTYLAADRCGTFGERSMVIPKLEIIDLKSRRYAIAIIGDSKMAHRVIDWMRRNIELAPQDREEYPSLPSVPNVEHTAIVAYNFNSEVTVEEYSDSKFPEFVHSDNLFIAWGSGRHIANGAMYMGADAKRAVEAANYLSPYCGFGYDAFHILSGELETRKA